MNEKKNQMDGPEADEFFAELGRTERVKYYNRIMPAAKKIASKRIAAEYWSKEVGKAYIKIIEKEIIEYQNDRARDLVRILQNEPVKNLEKEEEAADPF